MRRSISRMTMLLVLVLAACKGETSRDEHAERQPAAKQTSAKRSPVVLDDGADESKEAQACRAEFRWAGIEEVRVDDLARCLESTKQEKLKLTDAQYQALLDCKIAAKDMSEGIECIADSSKASLDAHFAKLDQKVEAELEAALAKLEAQVESGAVTKQTLALLRNPGKDVPPGRVAAVAKDAAALIDSGRVAAGEAITIHMHPGLGVDNPPPIGLGGAELVFVDAKTKLTVGRIAPLSVDVLGAKSREIAALIDWMLEDPATRQVEIVATTPKEESAMFFDPPQALRDASPRFEAAGIGDRPVIWLDGKAMTLAQWAERD